jgi:hypothetical protein
MTYYRYSDPLLFEEHQYDSLNELQLEQYEVLKKTPCGVWIKYPRNDKYLYSPMKYIEGKKFILRKIYSYPIYKVPRKCFAWPTKEEALISYIARKEKQIRLLEGQLECVKAYLQIAKGIQKDIS